MQDDKTLSSHARLEASDAFVIENAKIEAGSQLYRLFQRSNLTRTQWAEKLGTSKSYITKLFLYDVNFTVGTLALLAKSLNGRLQIQVVHEEEMASATPAWKTFSVDSASTQSGVVNFVNLPLEPAINDPTYNDAIAA